MKAAEIAARLGCARRRSPRRPKLEDRSLFAGMRLRGWRRCRRGKLLAFVDVTLPPLAMVLHGCPLFIGDAGPWAGLPSRPAVDERGRHKRGIDGKRLFEPVVEWTTRAQSDVFSGAVITLLRKHAPELLDPAPDPPPRRSRRAASSAQPSLDLGMAP